VNNLNAIDSKQPYDYRKLRGKIKEKFGTQSAFAKVMGLSNVSVSNKLNNNVEWGQEEIEKSAMILDIAYSDIHSYFFTHRVENNSTNCQKK
jgi:hypothetical protein